MLSGSFDTRAPVGIFAAMPDRTALLAAGGDEQLQRIDLSTGAVIVEAAHRERMAGMGLLRDGSVVTMGSNLRFVLRDPDLGLRAAVDLPALPNGLAVAADYVAVVFADGALRSFTAVVALRPERVLTDRPTAGGGGGGRGRARGRRGRWQRLGAGVVRSHGATCV